MSPSRAALAREPDVAPELRASPLAIGGVLQAPSQQKVDEGEDEAEACESEQEGVFERARSQQVDVHDTQHRRPDGTNRGVDRCSMDSLLDGLGVA